MREGWQRGDTTEALSLATVRAVVARLLPGVGIRNATPLDGGLANRTLRLELDAPPGRAVLRVWQRRPQQAGVELAVMGHVAATVAVPQVLAATLADPDLNGPCALLGWIDGERLQDLADEHRMLGQALGRTLAAIHRIGFPVQGFLNAALDVAAPLAAGSAGLEAFLRRCLLDGPGGARLGTPLTALLMDFAALHGGLLDHPWALRPCLSHADFNPSNLLLRRDDRVWAVAAVLDWEFAFAGGPAFDFGHVLRPPWADRPDFLAGVAEAYRDAGGDRPDRWQAIAQTADLFAWADFLGRPRLDDSVAASARQMIARIIGM